jgi:hypothetical protein
MVMSIFRRGTEKTSDDQPLELRLEVSQQGAVYCASPALENWIERLDLFAEDAFAVALLSQLEEIGLLERADDNVVLPWNALYRYLEDNSDSAGALLSTLKLPQMVSIRPSLSSLGSLEDQNFKVTLGTWLDQNDTQIEVPPKITGAIASFGSDSVLLSEPVWKLVSEVANLYQASAASRDGKTNRRAWARMREFSIKAKVPLGDFLLKTIVLTPQKIKLGLRNIEVPGALTLQVEPKFEGAPDQWLDAFDRSPNVPERYDIPTGDGIVQVIIDPEVRAVLKEIRRWPGRYVSGQRAEAFVRNPFAALGEDAAKVIDEQDFEAAREKAGIAFKRFTVQIHRTSTMEIESVGLLVESASSQILSAISLPFASPKELSLFVSKLENRLKKGFESISWKGHEFELLGNAEEQLDQLQKILREWEHPEGIQVAPAEFPNSPLISYANVYDLSNYSKRIEGIGIEKSFVSPFIAKKDEDSPWIPENTFFGVLFTPEGATEPVAVILGDAEKATLKTAIEQAKAKGDSTVAVPGVPGQVSIKEAKQVLESMGTVDELLKKGGFKPNDEFAKHPGDPKGNQEPEGRKSLVLRSNIDDVEYLEERRLELTLPSDARAQLPAALKPDVVLKDHQYVGVAWMQHLSSRPGNLCGGALLADDMGLGKTIQLLAFIQGCLESNTDMAPVLIVAPVSLLENWKEEIDKFFIKGAMPVLMLYGDYLRQKKLTRDEIDPLLVSEGIVRFLRPGWLGAARVVLTTYETLRDLEFSLAAQHWSIMICDEAQKIKNPNALVTRSAKKQNAQFKIACTGTPVENSLVDLWCLFDFIQPGLLGSLNHFGSQYRRPIEAKTEEEKTKVEELRSIIEPQTLRRTKKQVAKDLPQKIEVPNCRNIPLSPYQRQLYSHAVNLFKSGNADGPIANHLGMIQYLRQLCTDPRPVGHATNIHEPLTDYIQKSPKLRWLLGSLASIKEKGEKVIIFVEFQGLQRLLQRYIREHVGLTPDIINGTTTASATAANSRQKRIRAFQDRPGFGVIILSPLAVGFGVNIQAANHVIHYTRTWNPSKEDQATDRAYRIGATKDVYIYYPVITADFITFDMKLDKLLGWKRGLSEDMLNGCGDLSAADFAELGSPEGESVFATDFVKPEDIQTMNPKMFECLVAAIYAKKGYPLTYQTPDTNDAGVDVVAIKAEEGLLIQCKTTTTTQALGWEAVKDVVAGTVFYKKKHPGVRFTRVAATNATFNSTAHAHADANRVELLTATELMAMVAQTPISRFELEAMLVGPNH